jgi:hypothetical protein
VLVRYFPGHCDSSSRRRHCWRRRDHASTATTDGAVWLRGATLSVEISCSTLTILKPSRRHSDDPRSALKSNPPLRNAMNFQFVGLRCDA